MAALAIAVVMAVLSTKETNDDRENEYESAADDTPEAIVVSTVISATPRAVVKPAVSNAVTMMRSMGRKNSLSSVTE